MSKLAVAIKLKGVIICFCTAVLIFALSVSAYFSGAYAVYFGATPRLLPIYSVGREDKVVSISFDCAWGTEHTDDILNALRVGEVKATWFMVEFWTEKYPDYVKKIDAQGHEIGTHSATHSYMSKQNAEEIKLELKTSSEAITSITGKQVELFRPPYGDYDDELIKTASECGFYSIQWDVDSLDWKDLSATDIAMRVINGVTSGSIILMHNNGLHTAEAVPIIIETLKNRGYTFVPIGELIYRENYTLDSTGKQILAT
ncbi:MAG: polysaccharide deacetylase family protein [Candidatus Coproplasma sp.]